MNGAEAIVATFAQAGATVCFANPGTSELHLVEAFDRFAEIRGVLCLFEGVATGAADGFARMTRTPGLALLHQGPGLANGLANMHNARRAESPIVAVVGAGASTHVALDAPLETDVSGLARPMSTWVGVAHTQGSAVEAWEAALRPPCGPATLIVPADTAWSPAAGGIARPDAPRTAPRIPEAVIAEIAHELRNPGTALLLGGSTLMERGLRAADRIAQATGARVFTEAFPARQRRGAGSAPVPRLSGDAVIAREQLATVERLLLVGTTTPVAAFGQVGVRGELWPSQCTVERIDDQGQDALRALEDLAHLLAEDVVARTRPPRRTDPEPAPLDTPLDAAVLAEVVAAVLPQDAIVVDEANTTGGPLADALMDAAPHDVLGLRGFAIGQGLPLATGAAIACPQRPVLCLEADGSAVYTISALWTQARERTNVTTLILDNQSYAILRREAARFVDPGVSTSSLFDLADPQMDFVKLAEGFGVPASRAETAGELAKQLREAFAQPGPHLVHALIPSLY